MLRGAGDGFGGGGGYPDWDTTPPPTFPTPKWLWSVFDPVLVRTSRLRKKCVLLKLYTYQKTRSFKKNAFGCIFFQFGGG